MIRGSAGGWVGGRTVTVITRDVTASGGLWTGSEVSSCQQVPRPVRNPEGAADGVRGLPGVKSRKRPKTQWGPELQVRSRTQSNASWTSAKPHGHL